MDRNELLAALDELGDVLRRECVSARIYIVDGAAMALAYDAERSTRDIDAVAIDNHSAVMSAVREVAIRHGWPSTWLNEQATAYAPVGVARGARAVFDHPSLRVLAASPEHLLSMKARAARAVDRSDVITLASMTGCATSADVEALLRHHFPDEPMSERSRKILEDWLG